MNGPLASIAQKSNDLSIDGEEHEPTPIDQTRRNMMEHQAETNPIGHVDLTSSFCPNQHFLSFATYSEVTLKDDPSKSNH